MKSVVLSLMLVLALSPASLLAQILADRDISGVAGLRISPGAAQAGAAGAFGAVTSDAFSLYYNPAGSVNAGRYAAGFMHHQWVDDVKSEYLALIWRPDKVAFGASLMLNSVGGIERRNEPSTDPLSFFDAQDISAGLTTGFFISPEFSLGATAKIVYERIDVYSGTAVAVDFGGYYQFVQSLSVGMTVSNLGSKMKLKDQEDNLPSVVAAGGAYSYKTLRVGLNLVTPMDDKLHVHIGAENVISDILTLRAGYASGYDIRDIAFGFGIRHKLASIDYAYTPIDLDLGDSHRFSLTLSWR